MVIWVIGLSGAGKTTFAQEIIRLSKPRTPQLVWVDGDVARAVFGQDLDHSLEGRKENADRICRLCQFLDQQGLHVICSILSIFQFSRDWNKKNYSDYFEIYLDTKIEELIRRDSKGLYKKALEGEIQDFPGISLPFEPPLAPNMTIQNNGDISHLLKKAAEVSVLFTYPPPSPVPDRRAMRKLLAPNAPNYSFTRYSMDLPHTHIQSRKSFLSIPNEHHPNPQIFIQEIIEEQLEPFAHNRRPDAGNVQSDLEEIILHRHTSGFFSHESSKILNRTQSCFEVRGAIYDWQDVDSPQHAGPFKGVRKYCYLSLALLLRHLDSNSYNDLNTALKINDLLVAFEGNQSSEDFALMRATIALEISILENITYATSSSDSTDRSR